MSAYGAFKSKKNTLVLFQAVFWSSVPSCWPYFHIRFVLLMEKECGVYSVPSDKRHSLLSESPLLLDCLLTLLYCGYNCTILIMNFLLFSWSRKERSMVVCVFISQYSDRCVVSLKLSWNLGEGTKNDVDNDWWRRIMILVINLFMQWESFKKHYPERWNI